MEFTKYRLGDIADIKISGVDKKTTPGEQSVRLCNFVDVYRNWAITKELYDSFMVATANNNEISDFTIHKGQVAITKDSETRDDIGIATYISDDFEELVVLGYHTALITPNEDIILGKYLNALLHTKYFHDYWYNNASGSGMRYTLSELSMRNAVVLLPSIKTQRIVSGFLSSIDKKIAINRRINERLEGMAKLLYDYWFVQFEFPNDEGKPYKSSGGKMVWNEKLKREIPEGWEVKNINELSKSDRGVTYDKSEIVNKRSGILVLRGNNIQNNHIVYDSNEVYVPQNLVSENQKIKKNDIVMTMSSGSKEHIGKCIMFQEDSDHTFGAFLNKFSPYRYPHLLFLFFISDYFKTKIQKICSGTGINNLTNKTFDNIFIAIPYNQIILNTFELIIAKQYEEYGLNEKETNSLTSLRDFLLPMLMNGQVEIKEK